MTNPNAHTVIDQACLDEAERRNRLRAERQQAREELKKLDSVFDDRVPGRRLILTARVERKSLPTAARVAAILGGAPALGEISLRARDLLYAVEAVLAKRPAIDLGAERGTGTCSTECNRCSIRDVGDARKNQHNNQRGTAAERLGELRKYAYMHERNLHRLMEAQNGGDEDGPSRTQQATTTAIHAEIDKKLYGHYSSVPREPLSEDAITVLCLARCTTRAIVYELKAQKSNAQERTSFEPRGSTGEQTRQQELQLLENRTSRISTGEQNRRRLDIAVQKRRLDTSFQLKKLMLEQEFEIKKANLERNHRLAQLLVEDTRRSPASGRNQE
ncbi:hypothetical protein LTR56_003361 [Elasticomyces elasticus]|nr:hypothetical protein LTR56_003361 [Elasticomyces elasticus]KAK3664221.1 hypothetical protein LTR22_004919 [Elasticomyces elasticus]KAK4931436.1 hypothetical protein LTR49_002137 [Elasticomyces elasticus]KAK5766044.1 hypothetical protein LTS12_003790 [Elasticomyces elasticus]